MTSEVVFLIGFGLCMVCQTVLTVWQTMRADYWHEEWTRAMRALRRERGE